VYKHHFAQSDIFKTVFTLPAEKTSGPAEGTSEENPFVLQGIYAEDFEALLKVMVQDPQYVYTRNKYLTHSLNKIYALG
jgi:hypothetical protein